MADGALQQQFAAMNIAPAGETKKKKRVMRHILNKGRGAILTSNGIFENLNEQETVKNTIQTALRELRNANVLRVRNSQNMNVRVDRLIFQAKIDDLQIQDLQHAQLRQIGQYICDNYTEGNPGPFFTLENVAFNEDGTTRYNFFLVEQTVMILMREGVIVGDNNYHGRITFQYEMMLD